MLHNFTINMLSEQDRTIRVYLPTTYRTTSQRYPVLYMHDGKNVFRDEVAIGGKSLELENYLDQHNLEIIVIGIDAPDTFEQRANEYCPWKMGTYVRLISVMSGI